MRPHPLPALLALCLATGPAGAATRAEIRRAQVSIDTGTDHFRAGRFEEAIREFRLALTVVETPDLVWNIARAYEEMGDATNAVHHFRKFSELYPDDPSGAEVAERVGRLRVRLPGWIRPDCGRFAGARVTVDGGDPAACGGRVGPLPPGVHVVEAIAPGRVAWRRDVQVEPEGETEVRIRLEELAPEPVAAPGPPKSPEAAVALARPPEPAAPAGGDRVWPWVLAGGALAIGAVATLAGTESWDAWQAADGAASDYEQRRLADFDSGGPEASPSPGSREAQQRHGEASSRMLTWSAVSIGAAVVAAGAAGAALWLGLGERPAQPVRIGVGAAAGGGLVSLSGAL